MEFFWDFMNLWILKERSRFRTQKFLVKIGANFRVIYNSDEIFIYNTREQETNAHRKKIIQKKDRKKHENYRLVKKNLKFKKGIY